MTLDVRQVDGVNVLAVSGYISALETPGPLKAAVTDLMAGGHRFYVLSLGQLAFADSSFIGEMVACLVTITRGGGTLKLASIGKRLEERLVVTRLLGIFETYATEADALASFSRQ